MARRRRRRRGGRGGNGGGVAEGVGGGLELLGRLIALITGLIALIIVIGILLVVLEANSSNAIVSRVTDIARILVGPFDDLFTPRNVKARIAINWGIAAFLWFLVGRLIAGLLSRMAPGRARH